MVYRTDTSGRSDFAGVASLLASKTYLHSMPGLGALKHLHIPKVACILFTLMPSVLTIVHSYTHIRKLDCGVANVTSGTFVVSINRHIPMVGLH